MSRNCFPFLCRKNGASRNQFCRISSMLKLCAAVGDVLHPKKGWVPHLYALSAKGRSAVNPDGQVQNPTNCTTVAVYEQELWLFAIMPRIPDGMLFYRKLSPVVQGSLGKGWEHQSCLERSRHIRSCKSYVGIPRIEQISAGQKRPPWDMPNAHKYRDTEDRSPCFKGHSKHWVWPDSLHILYVLEPTPFRQKIRIQVSKLFQILAGTPPDGYSCLANCK